MKKIFKNPIFTFILGVLLTGSIGVVFAISYSADKVTYTPKDSTWKVDNAKAAIDDLKTKVKPEYTGLTTITPNTNSQTLYTNNKILNSNIIIEPIPSSYKNLTTQTDVLSNYLLNGIKAYTSDGDLITGNLSTNCVSGSYNKPANNQWNIELGFNPKNYILTWNNGQGDVFIYYNSNFSNIYMGRLYDNVLSTYNFFNIIGTHIESNFNATTSSYKNELNISYMACK